MRNFSLTQWLLGQWQCASQCQVDTTAPVHLSTSCHASLGHPTLPQPVVHGKFNNSNINHSFSFYFLKNISTNKPVSSLHKKFIKNAAASLAWMTAPHPSCHRVQSLASNTPDKCVFLWDWLSDLLRAQHLTCSSELGAARAWRLQNICIWQYLLDIIVLLFG